MDLKNRRILVTGGTGFIGSHVVERLRKEKHELVVVGKERFDLRYSRATIDMFLETDPEIVIHLAGVTGGILYNVQHPADLFFENLCIGTNVLYFAKKCSDVEKFVTIIPGCGYPRDCPVPNRVEDLWNGYPEPTSASYSLAKKMLLVQSIAYRQQFGFNSIVLIPENVYGPRDRGFRDPENAHVIPALISKFVKAVDSGEDSVTVWGSGDPIRSFYYVEDCAEAIIKAMEVYDEGEPLNIGIGKPTSIASLAHTIAHLTGFHGEISWDRTKPDGQPRRYYDVSRAEKLGIIAKTSLEDGLRKTIEWYRNWVRKK